MRRYVHSLRCMTAATAVTRVRRASSTPAPTSTSPSPSAETETPIEAADTVRAATERLRVALQAWSDVEQQKAANAAVARTQAARDGGVAVGRAPPPRPAVDSAPPVSSTAATPPTPATGSFAWIRNKRPKFWAGMVYVDGAAELASDSGASSEPVAVVGAVASPEPVVPAPTSASVSPLSPALPSSPPTSSSASTAASVRAPTRNPLRPFRNRYKRDVARRLSELLDEDPTLGPALLGGLSAESRRLLLVMGTASEYFGDDYEKLVQQVKAADRDQDRLISGHEFDQWASDSFARRPRLHVGEHRPTPAASAAAVTAAELNAATFSTAATVVAPTGSPTASASTAVVGAVPARGVKERILKAIQQHPGRVAVNVTGSPASGASPGTVGVGAAAAARGEGLPVSTSAAAHLSPNDPSHDPSYIPWAVYRRLVLAAAAPFLAFGILDNSTLILAGDAVDRYVSESWNLSEMAAAAAGGVVSGVAGVQVHGLAERWTRSTPPKLTAAQYRSRAYMGSERLGNTLGMVVGLILGMTPLLLIGGSPGGGVDEDAALLQREADRTRAVRRHLAEVTRMEHKQRGLVQFEEREVRAQLERQWIAAEGH